jgi:hypothetical protein
LGLRVLLRNSVTGAEDEGEKERERERERGKERKHSSLFGARVLGLVNSDVASV